MSTAVEYLVDKASVRQIAEHLRHCDADFVPALSCRVTIDDYARKIVEKALRIEAWSDGVLIGLAAVYCNDKASGVAYITSVSVMRSWTRRGIARRLIAQCVEQAKASGMRRVSLEVAGENVPAIKLYEISGFISAQASAPLVAMSLCLKDGESYE